MYQRIKTLADEAVALQNKDAMDAALREISALCSTHGLHVERMDAEQFEAAELAQHEAAKFPFAPASAEEKAAVLSDMKAQNRVGIAVVPINANAKKGAKK